MKFTVERDALHDALKGVSARTKSGPDIPILGHVLIVADGSTVTLTSHDTNSCSIAKIDGEVEEAGAITIPCSRLTQLMSGLPAGGRVIIAITGQTALVRCGKSTYKFGTMPAADFPETLTPRDAVSITLTSEQVARAFKTPAGSIGQEQSRIYLCGVCLHPHKEGIVAVATNGHTLVRVLLPVKAPAFEKIIVPSAALGEIVRVAGKEESTLEISQSLLAIESGSRRFVTKLIDGTYPDYERVIPQRQPNPFVVEAKPLDAALARLVSACDPDHAAVVKLAWEAEGSITASLRSQFADGSELIECDRSQDKPPGEVGMQIEYLRGLIEAASGELMHLHIAGPGEPVRIENPKAADFVAVCMPCRV